MLWQNPTPAKPLKASCGELVGKDNTAALLLSSSLLVQDFEVSFMMLLLYSLGTQKRAIALIAVDSTLQCPVPKIVLQKLHTDTGEYRQQDLWVEMLLAIDTRMQ